MLRSPQKGRAAILCVLCLLAMAWLGCGSGRYSRFVTPIPFYPTPTPFVTPECAGTTQDDPGLTEVSPTILTDSNTALGFQIRLPTWLPPNLTWDQEELLSTNAGNQGHYLVVPLFTALYGTWVSKASSSPAEMHDQLALDETTGTLTALTGLSANSLGSYTIHDHTDVKIGSITGALFHLVSTFTYGNYTPSMTALLWTDTGTGVTFRLTASTTDSFAFWNSMDAWDKSKITKYTPPPSFFDSWPQGDGATLLKTARSITVYQGCG
jgi:hypothetical protein